MGRRKGRGLREEERDLWSVFARSARPLDPRRIPDLPPPPPAPPAPELAPPSPAPPPLLLPAIRALAPKSSVALLPDPVTPLTRETPGLDRRTSDRMRRGRAEPEARIDLHGMTLNEAHDALTGFIRLAQARGNRCVLVITGKGRPREDAGWRSAPHGILKDSVPRWLSLPPLKLLVTGLYPAHQRHGGGGALYVYLRKRAP